MRSHPILDQLKSMRKKFDFSINCDRSDFSIRWWHHCRHKKELLCEPKRSPTQTSPKSAPRSGALLGLKNTIRLIWVPKKRQTNKSGTNCAAVRYVSKKIKTPPKGGMLWVSLDRHRHPPPQKRLRRGVTRFRLRIGFGKSISASTKRFEMHRNSNEKRIHRLNRGGGGNWHLESVIGADSRHCLF